MVGGFEVSSSKPNPVIGAVPTLCKNTPLLQEMETSNLTFAANASQSSLWAPHQLLCIAFRMVYHPS